MHCAGRGISQILLFLQLSPGVGPASPSARAVSRVRCWHSHGHGVKNQVLAKIAGFRIGDCREATPQQELLLHPSQVSHLPHKLGLLCPPSFSEAADHRKKSGG